MAEERAELLQHLRRQRRRAGDEEPHALPDRARGLRIRVEQPHVHRRHAEEERRLKVEKLLDRHAMIEPLQQPHPAPAQQPRVQPVAEGMNVKQRKREQEAVALGDLPAGGEVHRIGHEVVVRQHRPLRSPRRPRGINDRRRRAAIRNERRTGFSLSPRCNRRRNELPRLRIRQNVRDLPLPIQHVHRHEDHPGLHARQIQIDQLDRVRELRRQPVAAREAARQQRMRNAVAACLQLAERVRAPLPLQRRLLRARHEREIEELQQIHASAFAMSFRSGFAMRSAISA